MFVKATVLLAAASSASALRIAINNWCNDDVHIQQANPGYCKNGDMSMSNQCGGVTVLGGSGGRGNLQYYDLLANDQGTSIKMSRGNNGYQGIMQYEYTVNTSPQYGGLYWDLSMLDGDGPSRTGSPWFNDNVKISPTGNGNGAGTCLQFRCYPGQVCKDAYQQSAQVATRFCPSNTGDMFLDLCEPDPQFSSRKREMFEKAVRRGEISPLAQREELPQGAGIGGLHGLYINATRGISGDETVPIASVQANSGNKDN